MWSTRVYVAPLKSPLNRKAVFSENYKGDQSEKGKTRSPMTTVKKKQRRQIKDVPSSQCICTLSSVFNDRSGRHFLHILHHKAIIKNTRGKLQPFLSSVKGRRGGWKGRGGGRALLRMKGAKKRVVYAFQ